MTDAGALSPLLEQYEGVKARYPGHLVLFRVGDFFETFGDDAKLLSKELEVVLTARAPDSQGARTPMAGVPFHAVDTYLARLVRKGYKVALCDQVEDARFAKGLVRREVTRVVTPGTALEERILAGPDHNFLACAVLPADRSGSYAVVDVSTGEWYRGSAAIPGPEGVVAALAPFAPRELLLEVSGPVERAEAVTRSLKREFPSLRVEPAPAPIAKAELPEALAQGGGASELEADRRLASYVRSTQPRLLPYLQLVDRGPGGRHLVLDGKTLRHLEISAPMNPDDPDGLTLLKCWDATKTPPGRRTLSFWLKNPLADVPTIVERQDAVAWFVGRGAELIAWGHELARVGDIARIAARLAGRRIRPSELATLQESLAASEGLSKRLGSAPELPALLHGLSERTRGLGALAERLAAALPDAPPLTAEEGGLFRPGFAPEVDRLAEEERSGLFDLGALERTEQEASGIRTLKIGYNQVFGYYFEVTRPNLPKVPAHFRRKQTLSGGERFTSERLEEIEARILHARDEARRTEGAAWEAFLLEIESHVPALYRLSRAIGELDALLSLATVAQERGHVRPVVDEGLGLLIRDGRHPILDHTLGGRFVPNDTDLDGEAARLLVLTGPNMSGKSTYMRQVGLLVVLAQAGAFVPAKFARIGLVSALYTRMGFTDEIGRGKSSFMVEMTEVSEILGGADARSLVLLDEVGRGTSTFDGLALAWATLKHLHDRVRCRTVLATHYHQLTELVERLAGARNAHFAVRASGHEVVFLHRLVPGSTDRSYGIHVARLAGLPDPLLEEAERLLKRLEEEGLVVASPAARRSGGAKYTQAVLLSSDRAEERSVVEEEILRLDPNSMTPIQALQWITEARRRLGERPLGERR
jgi:DNA mismatch repair protein MutS